MFGIGGKGVQTEGMPVVVAQRRKTIRLTIIMLGRRARRRIAWAALTVARADEAIPPNALASTFAGTKAGQIREDNGLKMKLVWCPPGEFTMGSPQTEKGRPNQRE